jgi:hypothetical protein
MGCRNDIDVHIVQRPNSFCDCGKLVVQEACQVTKQLIRPDGTVVAIAHRSEKEPEQ